MKFRNDRPEAACGNVCILHSIITGDEIEVACLRIAGHSGECESRADEAAKADGVCHWCRNVVGTAHEEDCNASSRIQHNWSGWPGAYCFKCGVEDGAEIALANGWDGSGDVPSAYKNGPCLGKLVALD